MGQYDPGSERAPRSWLARHAEAVAFWALALAHLVPIWAFRYVPTQDGPAHVFNAQVLREYGQSAAGYEQYFELRPDPLPNLTSHLLLAGLLYVFPPLVAEKLLVSLYVLGFAGAFRWFLGAFGSACRPLASLGLLFVYNRCFWLGFYNWCLGLALVWAILAYCLRRRDSLRLPQMAVLMVLFTAAYFTHLLCFLLAWTCAMVATARRPRALLLVCLAAAPPACLTLDYFEQTGFLQDTPSQRLLHHPLAVVSAPATELRRDLAAIDRDLFEYQAGARPPFSLFVLPLYLLLAACTAAGPADASATPSRLLPFALGLLLLAAYLLAPPTLGPHGGFLKPRLALLPPLVWLACLRMPAHRVLRRLVQAAMLALVGANLLLVTRAIASGNEALAEYTAGAEVFGHGHRLFVIQPDAHPAPLADPLYHASHYYCLGTDSVNLNNYETDGAHFPVRFRPGLHRGRGNWASYPNQDAVDTILCWQTSPRVVVAGPADWTEIFCRGRLRLYRRPGAAER